MPQALIDAYFEAEDLRGLTNEDRLEQCVLSNGLARRFKNQKATQKKRAKRKRKRTSYATSESDTDDLLESISFIDQPGEIQGDDDSKSQAKITQCNYDCAYWWLRKHSLSSCCLSSARREDCFLAFGEAMTIFNQLLKIQPDFWRFNLF